MNNIISRPEKVFIRQENGRDSERRQFLRGCKEMLSNLKSCEINH